MLALDEARRHEEPLEGLDPHEHRIVEDGQLFDLEFAVLEHLPGLRRNHVGQVLRLLTGGSVAELLLELLERLLRSLLPLLEEGELLEDPLLVEVLLRYLDLYFLGL